MDTAPHAYKLDRNGLVTLTLDLKLKNVLVGK